LSYEESFRARLGNNQCNHYAESLKRSINFQKQYQKRQWGIRAEEMPWENSPQGLIKHVINEYMDTLECCLDMYQQLINPGGRSGKHRHMAEEVLFVLEGKGYDLHRDPQFDLDDKYVWSWSDEEKRFDWEEGDIVYIPPYTLHQHFNADEKQPARFITATNRIVQAMGFDWIDQVENAPEYKG